MLTQFVLKKYIKVKKNKGIGLVVIPSYENHEIEFRIKSKTNTIIIEVKMSALITMKTKKTHKTPASFSTKIIKLRLSTNNHNQTSLSYYIWNRYISWLRNIHSQRCFIK